MTAQRLPVFLAVATLLAMLVGCASGDRPTFERPPANSEEARPTPTLNIMESPGPKDPSLVFERLSINCESLLSAETLYEFNPNVGANPEHSPSARGVEAQSYGGLTCGWVNQTSGDTISISLARFDEPSLGVVRATAVSREGAEPVGDGIEGTLRRVNGAGALEVFEDSYWIVLESRMIVEAKDSATLITEITANLTGRPT